jgi:photosystem II stability/assembly factor-like uncharacterized protein
MSALFCLATARGVHIFERTQNNFRAMAHGLRDHRITSIIAREGVMLAGAPDGVWRSDDLGKTWEAANNGLSTRYVRWLAFHPAISDLEFAGTEPANIFISHNGGAAWRECNEISKLRDAHKWFLPYSSGAGCIRGFAFHGERAYAAAEVGGALRSDDRGETWRLCAGSSGKPSLNTPRAGLIHPDVHSLAVHPSSPDFVGAPTGGGYYQSSDGGATWELKYDCYVRAVWLDPDDARHQILGPADNVDANGRIEETHDGGATWHAASHDLPVPWRDHMVERFVQTDEELFAVLSNGQVLSAPLANLQWQPIFSDIANITALAAMKV